MRRRASLLLLPLLALALLVGCGDDDDSADADDTTTTAADEAPASDGDDEATDTSAADTTGDTTDSTETTAPGEVGGGEDTTTTVDPEGADDEAFCAAYAEFENASDELPEDTIEDLRAGTETLRELLATVGASAPDALQEDFATLDGAMADLQDIVDASDTVDEAEAAAGGIFEDDAFTEAGSNIDDYADSVCEDDDEGIADDAVTE